MYLLKGIVHIIYFSDLENIINSYKEVLVSLTQLVRRMHFICTSEGQNHIHSF